MRRGENSFDLVRLLAALLVFISHCWPLSSGSNANEPMMRLSGHLTLGAIGVDVFFVMSGYLIAQSWLRDPSLMRFATKRARRILPGLVFAIGWSILILPWLVGKLAPGDYFTRAGTWQYARAVTLFLPWNDRLPGIFEKNPYPSVVNGSLWTLEYEVICYGLIAALGVVGVLKRRPIVLLMTGAALLLTASRVALPAIPYLNVAELVRLASFFLVGASVFLFRNRIPWSGALAALCVAAWLFGCARGYGHAATLLFLPYATLFVCVGMRGGVRLEHDISYGIYIFAFPIQQIVVSWLGRHASPLTLALAALPPLLLMAALSWLVVERRFIRRTQI
jgi:peptidoglycan/LPS O-acetylase OafA/YrhL